MSITDVLEGRKRWHVEAADALEFLRGLPDGSVSLTCCSPPYERARLYLEGGQDLGIARDTEAWVAWLVEVVRECARVCTGLVALVVEGQTADYRYSCGPALLMADLHRAGFNLRRPLIYRRSGIPGSGGADWLRCDHEWIVCVTRPGRLPWSEPTACGHPPKWAPGGEMSHRLTNGQRVNGADDPWMKRGRGNNLGGRTADGAKKKGTKSSTARRQGTDQRKNESYKPPVLANPGTVHDTLYTIDEVLGLLVAAGVSDSRASAVIDCGTAGGGRMGNSVAHKNEAPYSERLCEVLIRSFCPPGGVVLDPFSGSGTTGAVAVRWGRRFLGCDLRQSQVEIARERVGAETPPLPGVEV